MFRWYPDLCSARLNLSGIWVDPLINPEPNVYEAVMIAEGVQPASEEEQIAAWQLLVNNGLAFTLQGWFGRTARDLIQKGVILPPQ